jgi:hypothetical protein
VYSAAVAQQPARIRAGSPAAPARFGDYLMCGLLARGGMAEVYLARHQAAPLGDVRALLAIKVMQPRLAKEARFVDMFRREGELALLLGGPCIVRTHAVGHEGGRPFIAMEYIPGRDLTQLMRRLQDTRTRLPIPHAVYLAARVAEGLAAAHGARDAEGRALHVVNRDVSPSNVRLSWDGDVKLLDFGIAQALMAFTSEIGVLKGKFSYMSPEQIRGMPLDARTDVFSTGIILHEMLTGEKLFRGDTEFALMERVRSADVAPPSRVNPKVSRELDAIVMRALAREVDDRYGSAAQLASDLDVLVRGYKFRPAELRQLMRQTFRKECADELAAAELAAKASAPADDAGELADHEGFEDLGPGRRRPRRRHARRARGRDRGQLGGRRSAAAGRLGGRRRRWPGDPAGARPRRGASHQRRGAARERHPGHVAARARPARPRARRRRAARRRRPRRQLHRRAGSPCDRPGRG